jgi:hypothetical protein
MIYTAFCSCGHHADRHDLDGKCADCDCMEFIPAETVWPEEE